MAIKKGESPFADDDIDNAPVEKKDPVVDLDDDDPDEVDAAPVTREEKKRQRAYMNRQDKERLERELAETKAAHERALLQHRLDLQQAQMFAQQQQHPQQVQKTPADEEVERLDREWALLNKEYELRYAQLKGAIPPQEANDFQTRAREVEGRMVAARVRKEVAGMGIGRPQADPRVEAIKAQLDMRYPDIVKNPSYLQYADGVQRQMGAQGHDMHSMETIEAAMEATRKAFRLGKYSQNAPREPAANMRERLSGAPRGAAGGQTERPDPNKFVMTKEMRQMANQAFGHIKNEKERFKAFARMQTKDDD